VERLEAAEFHGFTTAGTEYRKEWKG
jgi:hypothetical protein